jgi:hypothetical protein
MATYDALKAEHQTLSSTTADTVKLTQFWDRIEVINKSASTALYFSQTDATPTSAEENTEYVAPNSSIVVPALARPDGIAGDTDTPPHIVYVVGNGNAYGVVGIAGQG